MDGCHEFCTVVHTFRVSRKQNRVQPGDAPAFPLNEHGADVRGGEDEAVQVILLTAQPSGKKSLLQLH